MCSQAQHKPAWPFCFVYSVYELLECQCRDWGSVMPIFTTLCKKIGYNIATSLERSQNRFQIDHHRHPRLVCWTCPVHSQISGLQGEPLKIRVTSAKHTAHRQARWAKLFTNLSDVAGTVSRMGHRSGLCLTDYVLINMFIIVWYCNKLNLRCWCVIMNMLCSLLDHYWLCKFVFCLMNGYLVLLKAALCPKQPRWTDTVKTLAHNVSLFKFFHLLPILVVTLDF